MDEALKLATKVVVLHDGQLIQVGTPEEILHHPANDYVKSLIGEERLSEAKYETVKVKNVMLTNPIKIDLGASLSDALTMMKENRVDTLLVVDNSDHLKGYISIDDLQRNYSKASSVSDILITKVSTVGPDEYLRDNFSRIMSRNKSYIPVIDSDNKLVGIVTRASLVNVVYQKIWGDKGHTQNNTGKEAN